MPYTFDNIEIAISNNTAVIATDWGTSGAVGFSLAHAQIAKLAWGDENYTYRANETYPIPVRILGTTAGATLAVSGTISGTGDFYVRTNPTVPLIVKGSTFTTDAPVGITGTIQGVVNGTPVGVTGNVTIINQLAIFGISGATAIAVTGGRKLDSTTDSVTVRGYVGISGGLGLNSSDDSVKIYNANGGTAFNVNVFSGNGTSIGVSGDSLKVAVTNAAFSFSVGVTVGAYTGVTNYQGPLMVQGYTANGYPLTIKGSLAGGAVEVGAYTALPVGVSGTVSIDDTDIITSIDSLKTNIGTVATNAGYALDILNLVNSSGSGAKVNVASVTKPSRLVTGLKSLTTSPALLSTDVVKTGVTLKSPLRNQSDIYIGTSLNMTSSTSYLLSPGETIFLEISSLGNIFVRTVTGTADIVYIGT